MLTITLKRERRSTTHGPRLNLHAGILSPATHNLPLVCSSVQIEYGNGHTFRTKMMYLQYSPYIANSSYSQIPKGL